jgi:7-cyano-7-deazaguanine synthase
MTHIKKAVVLSSGGIDSTTVMAMAKHQGFEIHSLSFFYGQRHAVELEAAQKVADTLGAAEHLVINIDLKKIGGSSLTDDMDVPKARDERTMSLEIPVTYVPARNTIFLSFALAWAEVLESSDIFIGVNAIDYSGYPDCRPEYIHAFERMANLATKAGVEGTTKIKIYTPLIRLTKAQIIKKGIRLGLDYSVTHSCYDPSPQGLACGRCDSCFLRKKGFKEAGVDDPTRYV